MKFFRRIRSDVEVTHLLAEVLGQEPAWVLNTSRQDKLKVQRATNTIFLRSQTQRPDLPPEENHGSRYTAVSRSFPRCVLFLESFAQELDAQLSRAAIVRLRPHSKVFRHVDFGSYYSLRNRYHLVLYSKTGSVLAAGDEEVRMRAGELWWFNNKQYHEAHNDSDDWRIHIIFDLLPALFLDHAVNPIKPLGVDPTTMETSAHSPQYVRSTSRELLFHAITERAILRAENQRLIGPKGNENGWLIDVRPLLMESPSLNALAEEFCNLFADKKPFQVGGMEVGAIPLIAAIIMKSAERGDPINGFIVRKERKTYGTGNLIEGTVSDVPIILVDDILNSGGSLEKARVVLKRLRKTVLLAFVVIDYRSEKGLKWRERHLVSVHSLFNLADFNLSFKQSTPPVQMTLFEDVWRFAAPDPNFFHRVPKSFPATDGDHVYFGSDCGIFWCLNASDGSVAWQFKVNARGGKNLWSAPAIFGGKVFFGSYDGNVYCLNAVTGAEIWRFMGADWVGSSPALAPDLSLLFIGLEFAMEGKRGSIVALNLETGEKVWEHITKRFTHASPAYWPEHRLVACGSNDNEMFMFDAATGHVRWRFETQTGGNEKGSIRHAPAFDFKRGHLVTGCANGCIYVIDVETGKEVWSVRTDNTIYTVPLVLNDTAYVGSTDKYLYILDLDRREVKKTLYVGSKVFGPPRLLQARIYFGACNGIVYEIDPVSDSITGTHQLPDAVTNAVSFNPQTGHYYALTYVNELIAFKRTSQ